MRQDDVGCHVAALCAQTIEKSLKGYMLLNGATPAMNHRPDKYLSSLLTKNDPLLRYREHHGYLAKLFDSTTKGVVRHLFDLTPGGLEIGSTLSTPNTHGPTKERGREPLAGTLHSPIDECSTIGSG